MCGVLFGYGGIWEVRRVGFGEVAVQKGRQELKEEAREGGAKGALRGGGGRREWSFCSSHRGPAMFVLRRKTPQLTGQQHGIKCREYFEDNLMISGNRDMFKKKKRKGGTRFYDRGWDDEDLLGSSPSLFGTCLPFLAASFPFHFNTGVV